MDGEVRRLLIVSGLNMAGFAAELVGGLMLGSLALIGDAVHNLLDTLSYAMAFTTAWVATNVDEGDRWPYGFHRLETASAFINGAVLVPMAFAILYEAYHRVITPVEIQAPQVIAVAGFGLAINAASIWLLHGEDRGLNERGAYIHLLADAAGSVAVIGGMTVIAVTDLTLVDPVIAAGIAVMVLFSASKVLRRSTGILLQRSPVSRDAVREAVQAVDGVDEVCDIRTWEVCSQVLVGTVHVVAAAETLEDAIQIREAVHATLHDEFGIDHVTVQVEKDVCDVTTAHEAPTDPH